MEKKIYLDINGYNAYLKEIKDLEERLKSIDAKRAAIYKSNSSDGRTSMEFSELDAESRRIEGQLKDMISSKSRIVIVEKQNDENIIDINDIITTDIHYSDSDSEELTFKLVGTDGKFDSEIQEISLNSPLGSAVYKKTVGQECSYTVDKTIVNVLIKKKHNL